MIDWCYFHSRRPNMIIFCYFRCCRHNLLRWSLSNTNNINNDKLNVSSIRVVSKTVNYISVTCNTFIYAYMSHIHMLQLIEILWSVTNVPDILDIFNKYFARSTWTIFIFPSPDAIFEKSKRNYLTDINMHLLQKLASKIWNSIESIF